MNLFATITSFVRVAELGSFRRAADALNISTSAISTHIQALEEHLRVRLFVRSTRRLALTQKGEHFYLLAQKLLADLDHAETSIRGGTGLEGDVIVDGPATMVRLLLLPHWSEFHRLHPRIQLKFVQGSRFFGGREEDADLLLRFGPFGNSELACVPLGSCRTVCVASPGYLAQHGTPLVPQDIEDHQCLGFLEFGHAVARPWDFDNGTLSFTLAPKRFCQSFTDADLLLQAAIAGHGIAHTSDAHVARAVDEGRLVTILDAFGTLAPPFGILYRTTPPISDAARAFLNFIASKYPRDRPMHESPGFILHG